MDIAALIVAASAESECLTHIKHTLIMFGLVSKVTSCATVATLRGVTITNEAGETANQTHLLNLTN